jgi:mRNA interferase RelE/StbE
VAHEVVLTATLLETLEQFETQDAERIITKLEEIEDFPDHFVDRLKDHPGYKLRVGDFRVLIDWDKDDEMLYAIDAFERKKEYRELGTYREVWVSWRDDAER